MAVISGRHDEVLPATKFLAAAIIPFLVVAFLVLYPAPNETGRWFAWKINPTMTPMVLASAYIGGAYFFAQVLRASRWHTVKAGFVPVALFASSLGVATLLHWDKFNHEHVAFWLWSGLYFTTPFLVTAVWLRNRRQERGLVRTESDDLRLSRTARAVIGLAGLGALALGAFLFLWPEQANDAWPWSVTPLTARVMGAVLMLGVAGLGLCADPRWSTARLILQVERIMVALILLAAARAHNQFDTSRPLTWMLGGGLVGVLIGSTALDQIMQRRIEQRKSSSRSS